MNCENVFYVFSIVFVDTKDLAIKKIVNSFAQGKDGVSIAREN